MSFTFILPTNIRYGCGVSKEINQLLNEFKARKILLISDPGLVKLGLHKKILDLITNDKVVILFSDIEANPKDTNVQKGAELAQKENVDIIIAFGGGSVIDAAKAISVVAKQGGQVRDYVSKKITSSTLPFIAIPTTAGTGSEVTFSSVITDTKEHFKFTIKSPYMAAKLALVDPELTYSLPALITASTGMDALTHAIEGYSALCTNPIAESLGLYAAELIGKNIIKAVQNPDDLIAKDNMMMGSLMAGLSFSHSDVASVHCMAEALGSIYDLPHGLCNSIILPYVMRENSPYAQTKYARIAKALGIVEFDEEICALKGIERIEQISKEIGLPQFKSLNINDKDFDLLAKLSFKNGSNDSNPKPMTHEDYKRLFTLMNS